VAVALLFPGAGGHEGVGPPRVWVRWEGSSREVPFVLPRPARPDALADAVAPALREALGDAPRDLPHRFLTTPLAWLCPELEPRVGRWLGCYRNSALGHEAGRLRSEVDGELRVALGRERRRGLGWQAYWIVTQSFGRGPGGWAIADDERVVADGAGYTSGHSRLLWRLLFELVEEAPKRSNLRFHILSTRVFAALRGGGGKFAERVQEREQAVEVVYHGGAGLPDRMAEAWRVANLRRWELLSRAPHGGTCQRCGAGIWIPERDEHGAYTFGCTACRARGQSPIPEATLRRWFVALSCTS